MSIYTIPLAVIVMIESCAILIQEIQMQKEEKKMAFEFSRKKTAEVTETKDEEKGITEMVREFSEIKNSLVNFGRKIRDKIGTRKAELDRLDNEVGKICNDL